MVRDSEFVYRPKKGMALASRDNPSSMLASLVVQENLIYLLAS